MPRIMIVIFIVGICCSIAHEIKKNRINIKVLEKAFLTIALGVISSFVYDGIGMFLSPIPSDDASTSIVIEEENEEENDNRVDTDKELSIDGELPINKDDTSTHIASVAEENMKDITGEVSVNGIIEWEGQTKKYKYIPKITGTYRFEADLSTEGDIWIQVSGESEKIIDGGTNAVTINLEAGKKYIIDVKYRNCTCDYTLNIGAPIAINDITGSVSFSGKIEYKDQGNQYLYTTTTSGTYRFDTDLSAGGSVQIRISGENGNFIATSVDSLTIDLQAGKTYLITVEYRNGVCDYTVNIGVPIDIGDITDKDAIAGRITYKQQKDKYRYTAKISGTYRFDTDLSAGGNVRLRVSGEDENSIATDVDGMTVDLEGGKTYIISVEYQSSICDYTVYIGVPIEIRDVTSDIVISGDITYRDQKDKYLYTAQETGKYRFDTN